MGPYEKCRHDVVLPEIELLQQCNTIVDHFLRVVDALNSVPSTPGLGGGEVGDFQPGIVVHTWNGNT